MTATLAALATVAWAAPSQAQVTQPTIEVWPGDDTIQVTGTAGSGATLQRSFRLRASASGGTEPAILPSDLMAKGELALDRDRVSVERNGEVRAGWQDYRVTLTGVPPGSYEGTLTVRSRDGENTLERVLRLQVTARATDGVRLAPESVSMSAQRAATCNWLTKVVLGGHSCSVRLVATLVSDDPMPPVRHKQLILTNGAGVTVPSGLAPEVGVEERQAFLQFDGAKNLPPDHYKGRYVLSFDGAAATIEIPVDIRVKDGPVWPLLAIFAGVLLGFVVSGYKEWGAVRARLRARLDQAREDWKGLVRDDAAALESLANKADRLINGSDAKKADEALVTLEEASEAVLEAHRLTSLALPPAAAAESMKRLRRTVFTGSMAAAKGELESIRAQVEKIPPTEARAVEPMLSGSGRHAAPPGDPAVSDARASQGLNAPPDRWARLSNWGRRWKQRFMQYAAGPIVWFTVLVTLVITGFETLYVNGSPTFGSRAIVEYGALLAWGMGAKAASGSVAGAVPSKPY